MSQRIGFIGVGLMGHGMARNLLLKGFSVSVLGHRNRAPVESLVGQGATESKDVASLVAASDIVILCVTGSPQVEDLVYRADGILASGRPGQIVIDTSTSLPSSTLRMAGDLKARGITLVDAPLTRTPVEAEQGRLNSMVGADAATFTRIEAVLRAFCENVFHVGDTGAGHTIKLINNFAAIAQSALIGEALCACVKLGVEPQKYFDLVSVGAANSGIFQMIAGGAVKGDFTGMKFALVNAAKDVRYYNQMAAESGLTGAMAAALQQTMLTALAQGFADPRFLVGSLVESQAKLNGVQLPSAR